MKYMGFDYTMPLEGVYHISDRMGVCMTLLTGTRHALLVDTGYGLEDVSALVKHITPLPCDVLLTHGHHDHALGARCFEITCMFPEDLPDFRTYTGRAQREKVLAQAEAKGFTATDREGFLNAVIAEPIPPEADEYDLGGLTAKLIPCPGHTPGSCMVYVPEHRLLLTGDNWNPCTWLFFERAVPVQDYRRNMMEAFSRLDITHALCPHQPFLYGADKLNFFLANLTDENLASARKVNLIPGTDTRELDMPDGQYIVFDYGKFCQGKHA